MPTRIVKSVEELDSLADEILSAASLKTGVRVLALSGELGSGKTAFVQTLARKLGVQETVTSPTFTIMRTYKTGHDIFKKLVHIDAYRVEEAREMEVLDIPERFVEKGTLVCVEWPERIGGLLPEDAFGISFTLNEDGTRTVTY